MRHILNEENITIDTTYDVNSSYIDLISNEADIVDGHNKVEQVIDDYEQKVNIVNNLRNSLDIDKSSIESDAVVSNDDVNVSYTYLQDTAKLLNIDISSYNISNESIDKDVHLALSITMEAKDILVRAIINKIEEIIEATFKIVKRTSVKIRLSFNTLAKTADNTYEKLLTVNGDGFEDFTDNEVKRIISKFGPYSILHSNGSVDIKIIDFLKNRMLDSSTIIKNLINVLNSKDLNDLINGYLDTVSGFSITEASELSKYVEDIDFTADITGHLIIVNGSKVKVASLNRDTKELSYSTFKLRKSIIKSIKVNFIEPNEIIDVIHAVKNVSDNIDEISKMLGTVDKASSNLVKRAEADYNKSLDNLTDSNYTDIGVGLFKGVTSDSKSSHEAIKQLDIILRKSINKIALIAPRLTMDILGTLHTESRDIIWLGNIIAGKYEQNEN